MRDENMFCVVLFGLFSVTLVRSALTGMFKTECRDRHFWLSVKSHFLGSKFWFEVRGESGVRPVDGQWAAECGYTLQRDSWGDLTLRASYLACTVDNQGDSEFRLMLWFVNEGADGEGMSHHPLLLSCSLAEPWRPREVVCENNYMEVSVEKRVPADNHRGTEWVTPAPADDTLREWRVLFRVPDLRLRLGSGFPPLKEEIIPVNLVHLLGYSINTTASRIVLRCSYGSRLAYTLQGDDFTVEVVSTTIIYRHHWTLLRVDMSVACTTTQGSLDGADVVWTLPWLLHPLVVPPVGQKNLKVAVGGRYITQCMARYRDYRIHDNNNTVEIRIPFGAEGGRLKSGVFAGVYVHLYEVDVELLREWQDSAWKQTQQRTFRTLRVHQNDPINISKLPSGGELVLSVGDFLSDVMLVNVTVAGQRFSLEDAERNAIRISQVPFPNGTHSYLLQVPLTHPLITQQYWGKGRRSYLLSVLFSFLLSPDGETFHIPADVHSSLQDVDESTTFSPVVPWLKGECMERGVRILVHYGKVQGEWRVYVGGLRLDWQLVQDGQYVLDSTDELITVDIPLYAPGMDYRGLDLRGLAVSVSVSLVHMETLEEFTHLQECVMPVEELLVCLPDGQMVVVLDMSGVLPPVDPKHTALLDPSCGPLDTDRSKVLFRFPAESCGSTITHMDGHVIYINEVRLHSPGSSHVRPHPHPHLSYSVPVMCVYPENEPRSVSIYRPRSTVPPTAALKPPSHTQRSEIKQRPLPAGG
ncbi:rhodopsin kinase GRK1b isoform X2 [Pygocentrus nattereri]|uniref:rhodopsin kinase GRK1b isoform X2 n=1 Tax=Pygocentrus nattereri TaxID=42514 RepID=UPI00081456EB|nr:rhodopsin kinase GRK1b isoform X2 [Pygocentrus nattereri]